MKSLKSNVRLSYDRAKHGGKKGAKAAAKGKKSEATEEKQGPENCAVFVALEFPDWYKETVQILAKFEFDAEGKI